MNEPRNETNLFVFLAGDDGGSQSRLVGLRTNGDGVEQVSCALLRFLLSGELMRSLVLLLRNAWTELVCYPVERIVEGDSKHQTISVNYSNELLFTYPLRGTHCT